jgi:hypothetical protein
MESIFEGWNATHTVALLAMLLIAGGMLCISSGLEDLATAVRQLIQSYFTKKDQ